MSDMHNMESWVAMIATGAATVWAAITVFFNLKSEVKAQGIRIDSIESHLEASLSELKSDIKDVGEKSEIRHSRIEDKLDRLIFRGNTRHDDP